MEMVHSEVIDKYPVIYSPDDTASVKRRVGEIKRDLEDMGFETLYIVSTLLKTDDDVIFPAAEINLRWDPSSMDSALPLPDYEEYKSDIMGKLKQRCEDAGVTICDVRW